MTSEDKGQPYTEEPLEPPYHGPDGGLLILSAVIPIVGIVIGLGYCLAKKPKKGLPLVLVALFMLVLVFALRQAKVI